MGCPVAHLNALLNSKEISFKWWLVCEMTGGLHSLVGEEAAGW